MLQGVSEERSGGIGCLRSVTDWEYHGLGYIHRQRLIHGAPQWYSSPVQGIATSFII